MITDNHILYMLREAKARAKQKEYKIPQEEYPNFQTDSRDLDYTTIYIISKYAEAIISDNKEELDSYENDLKVASQYFDAATNIVREFDHSIDYLLLGACAYYLSEDFGSAKALLLQLSVDNLNSYRLLTYLIISSSLSKRQYKIELNEFERVLYGDFLKYLDGGEGYESVLTNILKYRNSIMKSNDIFAVLYIDILHAVIKKTIQNSSWKLIPLYSRMDVELWRTYLSQSKSTKILWSAQKLIGENGIFAGSNGIIQLPTGVGKTKSIELIIRSAFLSGRTNTVLIIAPLRALCGEIKSDLQFAFGNEANINHYSDVLQDDFNLLFEDDKNNIIISTPEKMEYIIYHQKDLLDRVGLYIFDEGHMFDSRSRGASYELLVTTIKRAINWTKQIVFISAVLSNADDIGKWLLGEEATIVSSDRIKTTEKNIGFVSLQEADSTVDYYADFDFSARSFWVQNVIKTQQLLTSTGRLSVKSYPEKNAKDVSIYLMELLDSNGAVAIYVKQPSYIKSYIDRVIELEGKGVEFNNLHNSFNLLESEKIHNLMRLHYGDNCTYCNGAALGIFPHYSDLQEGVKLSIEFAIRNQLIKNVICTSTLAQGVNLPIKYLLITAFDGFQNKMKARDLQNLIGRTARSGIYTEGSIIVTDINLYKQRNVQKGGGIYKWRDKIKLFDRNNSEPCKSAILSLIENVYFGYTGQAFVKIGSLVRDQIEYYHYLTREQEIEATKRSNSILYEARRNAKIDKCLICGRAMNSFCNSHTVPQFSLRKISPDGIVLNFNSLLESPAMRKDSGLNQAGVFHVICHDCDNKVFQEYENPNNYKEESLSTKMMAEIALKNYLKLIDKKLFERVLNQLLIQRFPHHQSAMQHRLDVVEFDYNNYKVGFEKAKRLSKKDDNDGYYLIYYKLLNYTAPMAFQAAITLAVDFEGEIVNAIYNMNSNYKMKELHLAVLPMNGKTAIVMFIDNGEKRYKSFIRQFNQLSECDKLGAINYLIFLYSEDYFFSKTIKDKIDTDCLRRIAGIMPQYYTFETKEPRELLSGDFRLDKWNSIPNLLDRTYAIE